MRYRPRGGKTLFFGWVVAGGAFAVLSICYGLQFSYGVFLPEMADELGWSRADLTAPYSVFVLAYTLLSFVAGRMTDRVGPRTVVAVGALGLGIGYTLLGTVEAKWQLYLYLSAFAALGASVAFVPCNATVIRWFVRRRGLALGVASSGTSFASVLGPLLAATLIGSIGWRNAWFALGIGGALALLLASRALYRDPESRGLVPDGDVQPRASTRPGVPPVAEPSWTLREARASAALWLLIGALCFSWLVVFMPFVHLTAYAMDLGIARTDAAALLGAIGLGGLAGRVATGGATDRIGRMPGLVLALLLQILAFFGFAISESLAGLYAGAFAFGFAYSSVSVLFPAILGDYFGRAHAGSIAGFAFAIGGPSAAAGPYFAGVLYDATGTYDVAFVSAAVLNSFALLLLAFLRTPSKAPRTRDGTAEPEPDRRRARSDTSGGPRQPRAA